MKNPRHLNEMPGVFILLSPLCYYIGVVFNPCFSSFLWRSALLDFKHHCFHMVGFPIEVIKHIEGMWAVGFQVLPYDCVDRLSCPEGTFRVFKVFEVEFLELPVW